MTNYRREARSHAARAGGATRSARRDAEFAAEQYEAAAKWTGIARERTARPSPWATAAEAERTAQVLTHLADSVLRASFRDDERAETYRQRAAKYRVLADEQDARIAEFKATVSAVCWDYQCGSCDGTRADGASCEHHCHEKPSPAVTSEAASQCINR